jgi:hypothetical protein
LSWDSQACLILGGHSNPEDRNIRADAQHQGNEGDRRKRGRLAQDPQRITDVKREIIDQSEILSVRLALAGAGWRATAITILSQKSHRTATPAKLALTFDRALLKVE